MKDETLSKKVKCRWVKMVWDIPICTLHCIPCARVDIRDCENAQQQDGNSSENN